MKENYFLLNCRDQECKLFNTLAPPPSITIIFYLSFSLILLEPYTHTITNQYMYVYAYTKRICMYIYIYIYIYTKFMYMLHIHTHRKDTADENGNLALFRTHIKQTTQTDIFYKTAQRGTESCVCGCFGEEMWPKKYIYEDVTLDEGDEAWQIWCFVCQRSGRREMKLRNTVEEIMWFSLYFHF